METFEAKEIANQIVSDSPDLDTLYSRAEDADLPVDYDGGFERHRIPEGAAAMVIDCDGGDVVITPAGATRQSGYNVDVYVDVNEHPRTAALADALRREIARRRDRLKAKQRSDYDERRQHLIDRLSQQCRSATQIALESGSESDGLETPEVKFGTRS